LHPDLVALLDLQQDDLAIAKIESSLEALEQRGRALDQERALVVEAAERSRATAEQEEKRRRELAGKVQEHKALQDRNLAVLEAVRKAKEAAAAMSQIELTRKVLVQEESDLSSLTARVKDLHDEESLHEQEIAALDERQKPQRDELAMERRSLEEEMRGARLKREGTAARVSRAVLAKYERIRERAQSEALYPLNGAACGRCNTAIPLQRRNVLVAGRGIDVCEGCGVLLYATQ